MFARSLACDIISGHENNIIPVQAQGRTRYNLRPGDILRQGQSQNGIFSDKDNIRPGES